MTQHITVEEVKAACRTAYKEKRLIAQDPDPVPYGYRISGSDGVVRVCAIGAVLNEGTLNVIDTRGLHSRTIFSSYGSGKGDHAFSWNHDEKEDLIAIQRSHDYWLRDGMGREGSSLAEKDFMEKIGL